MINNFIKLITLSLSRYKLSNRYAPKSITNNLGVQFNYFNNRNMVFTIFLEVVQNVGEHIII